MDCVNAGVFASGSGESETLDDGESGADSPGDFDGFEPVTPSFTTVQSWGAGGASAVALESLTVVAFTAEAPAASVMLSGFAVLTDELSLE